MNRIRVAAAVVWDGPRLLMTQRPAGGALGLQWEFPGGKIERDETAEHAIVREVTEELGVTATPHERIRTVSHDYAHGTRVEIVFVRCTLDSHAFNLSAEVNSARWQRPEEIDLRQVLEADRDFLRELGAREPAATAADDTP
jgi:8-oxo-dGTP diphosphatase